MKLVRTREEELEEQRDKIQEDRIPKLGKIIWIGSSITIFLLFFAFSELVYDVLQPYVSNFEMLGPWGKSVENSILEAFQILYLFGSVLISIVLGEKVRVSFMRILIGIGEF